MLQTSPKLFLHQIIDEDVLEQIAPHFQVFLDCRAHIIQVGSDLKCSSGLFLENERDLCAEIALDDFAIDRLLLQVMYDCILSGDTLKAVQK